MPILGIIASQDYNRVTNSYESISTVTVGSGGAANIEFTSIPATYTHLQIRGIVKGSDTADDRTPIVVQYNSDTGNNYARHLLGGNGSATFLDSVSSTSARAGVRLISSYASYASMFTTLVIDILDYANTNKYTTTRTLGGFDTNGGSFQEMVLGSFLWSNTAAITTIKLVPGGGNFVQYSQFALYGVRA
jgi:hypothetical protein